ncbi:MAG: hypothetical protein DRP42_05235, partial [Tenericutes bacterium]
MKRLCFTILFIIITSLSAWAGELTQVPYPKSLDNFEMPSVQSVRNVVTGNRCVYGVLTADLKEQIVQDYMGAFKKHQARLEEMKTWRYFADRTILYVFDPHDGRMENAGAMRAGFGVSIVKHPKVKFFTHSVIIHLTK